MIGWHAGCNVILELTSQRILGNVTRFRLLFVCRVIFSYLGFTSCDLLLAKVVMDTGMDIPGGYAGKGTAGTGTDTLFCTRYRTRTHTRQTRTHRAGFVT